MKAKNLCAVLAACLALTACGTAATSGNTAAILLNASQEVSVGTEPDESTVRDAPSQEAEPPQEESTMKNIFLGKVPNGYYNAADQQGKLENFTYDTKDYIGNGNTIQSSATVYLPYGYEQTDSAARYNILYLQHGAYQGLTAQIEAM